MAYKDTTQKINKHNPKYDREEIVQLIVMDILNGMSRYRVLLKLERDNYVDTDGNQIISSKWGRSTRYNLIQEAYENCKIPLAEDRQKARDLMMARLEDILEEARDARDRTNAIAAIKEINKIMGLYEAEKLDIKADVNGKVEISFGFDNNE